MASSANGEKKSRIVLFRVTPSDGRRLEQAAAASGKLLSAYLRERALRPCSLPKLSICSTRGAKTS